MKRNSKIGIIALIILLSIGFAAVTTNLIINGQANVSVNADDFDVYFYSASAEEGGTAVISEDKKTITYNTKRLSIEGDKAILNYTVFNNSSQYDATVTVTFNATDTVSGVDYSDYFQITRTGFGSQENDRINAKEYKDGIISIQLIKSFTGEDVSIPFTVTIDVTAAERTSPGEPTEDVLNGTVYDDLGQPMRNAAFVAFSDPVFFKTDSEGHYSIRIPVGEHHIYHIPGKDIDDLVAMEDDFRNNNDVLFNGEYKHYMEVYPSIKYNEDVMITTVDTNITTDIIFHSYAIGDEISIGNEKFLYFETKANGDLVLLAKHPLNLGSCMSKNNGGPVVQNKDNSGNNCTVSFDNDGVTTYEDSDVKTYVDNYVNYLKTINSDYNVIDGGLLNLYLINTYYISTDSYEDLMNSEGFNGDVSVSITATARQNMDEFLNYNTWTQVLTYRENHGICSTCSGDVSVLEGEKFLFEAQSGDMAVRPIIYVRHK